MAFNKKVGEKALFYSTRSMNKPISVHPAGQLLEAGFGYSAYETFMPARIR
jgi:hypothetical protein